jgi:hypothetical protein
MTTLKNIFSIQAPDGLVQAVLLRIQAARTRETRQKIAMWVSAEVAALAACILAVKYAVQAFAASAFPHYLSLIFSDRLSILGYWQQFLAALSESVPLVGVALVGVAVITVLFILKNILSTADELTYHHTYV